MGTKKVKTDVRQEQIAKATLRLVGRKGFRGVSIADIAREVGIVPSAICEARHEGSAGGRMLSDVLRRRFRDIERRADRLHEHPADGQDVLLQIRRMLPDVGWLTERLARLREKAYRMRQGHVARIHEVAALTGKLPPSAKRQLSGQLQEQYRELGLDLRLERLDRAAAEAEKRIRNLTQEAERCAASYGFRRLHDALKAAEKGWSAGGRAPYGFKRALVGESGEVVKVLEHGEGKATDKQKVTLVLGNAAEVEVARDIFRQFLEGAGYRTIAERLNAEGVPSARNGAWASTTIRGILLNPHHVGDAVWSRRPKGKFYGVRSGQPQRAAKAGRQRVRRNSPEEWVVVRDAHLGIVDRQTSEAAQGRIKNTGRNDSYTMRHRISPYPLSGLLHCGCGNLLRGQSHWQHDCRGRRIEQIDRAVENATKRSLMVEDDEIARDILAEAGRLRQERPSLAAKLEALSEVRPARPKELDDKIARAKADLDQLEDAYWTASPQGRKTFLRKSWGTPRGEIGLVVLYFERQEREGCRARN